MKCGEFVGYAFISYCTKNQDSADNTRHLFMKNGVKTWMAPYDIPVGSEYAQVIHDAIAQCDCFVLLLTDASQNSPWVKKEVNIAVSLNKTIIPVMLEDVKLNGSMMLYVNDQQIVRVHKISNKSDEFKKMFERVRYNISEDTPAVTDIPTTDTPETAPVTDDAKTPVNEFDVDNTPSAAAKTDVEDAHSADNTIVVPEATEDTSDYTPIIIVDESKEDKRKNRKYNFAIGLIICSTVLAILLTIFLFWLFDDNRDNEDKVNETFIQETEISSEISDELFDFMFILDGEIYQLPCDLQEFKDNGWEITDDSVDEDTLLYHGDIESYEVSKGSETVELHVRNSSGNAKTLSDCDVDGIRCDSEFKGEFRIAKGIELDFTFGDLTDAFGYEYEFTSNIDEVKIWKYVNEYSYDSYAQFSISESGYKVIILRSVIEELDDTETDTERPSYLDEYVAPKKLGNDHLSSIIEVDKDLYQIPCPVSCFLDNGWELETEITKALPSGDVLFCVNAEKGEKSIELMIENLSEHQVEVKNCVVTEVAALSSDHVDIKIPSKNGSISFESTSKDLEKAITDDFYNKKSDTFESYTLRENTDDDDRNYKIELLISSREEDQSSPLFSIHFSCDTWNYK